MYICSKFSFGLRWIRRLRRSQGFRCHCGNAAPLKTLLFTTAVHCAATAVHSKWLPKGAFEATVRSKGLLELPLVPQGRSNGLLEPLLARKGCVILRLVRPGRSKGLLEHPLGAPRALKGAAQACSVSQDAPKGCSSFWSVPQVRSERHFQPLSLSVR